jgi:hypothetical protein
MRLIRINSSFGNTVMACILVAMLCGVAAGQRAGSGDGGTEVPISPRLPVPEPLPPVTSAIPAFPGTVAARPLATLISGYSQCGSDDGREVAIVPPSGIPPTALNQALANLVFTEPSWSLTDVKRAVRMMGATRDPSAGPLLEAIIAQAPVIVGRRAAGLARTLTRADVPTFQAWLQSEATDLRQVAREQLPRTRRAQ